MKSKASSLAVRNVARKKAGLPPVKAVTLTDAVLPMLIPHEQQRRFIESKAPRKVIRAGRRGGKTIGIAILAVRSFLLGRRVLYAAPTAEQVGAFWQAVVMMLQPLITSGVLHKNETEHFIELPGTKQRIRAKTAWNADTLRGDYADLLILDEFQLMNEEVWGVVGVPMLADNNGDAVFIYTPPSLRSRSTTKANDPQHAPKLFKKAAADKTGRWETFHFSSFENPHISEEALNEMINDMTAVSYRMEIKAEDLDEAPGALWTREIIEAGRVTEAPDFVRVVVAVDPSATSTGDAAGIITMGKGANKHGYLVADDTVQGSPTRWATAAVEAYYTWGADLIVAEANNGGEMVELTIHTVDKDVRVKLVHASRGKQTRAEPVAALYEHGVNLGGLDPLIHHVGHFDALEDECCLWTPGDDSPNRLDANVWAATELLIGDTGPGVHQISANLWPSTERKPPQQPDAPNGPTIREPDRKRGLWNR